MKLKSYTVTMPIAGHIVYEVEAASKEEALDKAWAEDPQKGELSWEILDKFCSGNVLHCPSPNEIEVDEIE